MWVLFEKRPLITRVMRHDVTWIWIYSPILSCPQLQDSHSARMWARRLTQWLPVLLRGKGMFTPFPYISEVAHMGATHFYKKSGAGAEQEPPAPPPSPACFLPALLHLGMHPPFLLHASPKPPSNVCCSVVCNDHWEEPALAWYLPLGTGLVLTLAQLLVIYICHIS